MHECEMDEYCVSLMNLSDHFKYFIAYIKKL